MVTNNHSFEEQIRRILAEVQSQLKSAQTERDKWATRAVELAGVAGAYEKVLQHQAARQGKADTDDSIWKELLRGLNHREQILVIAEKKEGEVRKADATDILYTLGFIKAKSRAVAYNIVQQVVSALVDDGLLAPTEKAGVFRRVNPNDVIEFVK